MNWQTWSPDIPGQGCVPPENISHRVTANAQTSDADENLLLVRHSAANLNNSINVCHVKTDSTTTTFNVITNRTASSQSSHVWVNPLSHVQRLCHYKYDYIITVIMTPLSSQCHHRYNDCMSVVIPVTTPSQVWRLYTCNSVVTWTTTSSQIPRLRALLCSSVLAHQYDNSWTWENN